MIALRHSLAMLVGIALLGCASAPRDFPAPKSADYERAEIAGFKNIRFYGDEAPPFLSEVIERLSGQLRSNPSLGARIDMLALSGGAEDGAYGAGFLKGWTERGDRPEFTWVTGVSTGALMAPFAFLGSDYDFVLEKFFTETSVDDIVVIRPQRLLFGEASIGDTAPLRQRIAAEITPEVLQRIREENLKGRTLLIGTTNLDAQRPVIWDIGRIASIGGSRAEGLIEDILLASASIPGAFPPVYFDVTIDGQQYQEVHGDGGVTYNVFAYPAEIIFPDIESRLGLAPRKTMWVIRNTKLDADFEAIDGGLPAIASRAISTMIKYQGRGDISRLQALARRDGFAFRFTSVPQGFDFKADGPFDQKYMQALYKRGYEQSLSTVPWQEHFQETAPTSLKFDQKI